MLSKEQLQDAARCRNIDCDKCEMEKDGDTYCCVESLARFALDSQKESMEKKIHIPNFKGLKEENRQLSVSLENTQMEIGWLRTENRKIRVERDVMEIDKSLMEVNMRAQKVVIDAYIREVDQLRRAAAKAQEAMDVMVKCLSDANKKLMVQAR